MVGTLTAAPDDPSDTVEPFVGAGPDKVTVQEDCDPEPIDAGEQLNPETITGAFSPIVAFATDAPSMAVTTAF